MDYGKYMYERARREREARKTQRQTEIKEIRLRPRIAEHDLMVKMNRVRHFLENGAKVRLRVRFRGREVTHQGIARELLERVAEEMKDIAVIEKEPAMEGMTMLMILAPGKPSSSSSS